MRWSGASSSDIDPRVDPTARTTKVRVGVPNPGGDLRIGMFVTVTFQTGTGGRVTLVPRAAVEPDGGDGSQRPPSRRGGSRPRGRRGRVDTLPEGQGSGCGQGSARPC